MASRENVSTTTLVNATGEKVTSPLDAAGVKWDFHDLDAVAPEGAPDDWKQPVIESRIIYLNEINAQAPEDVDTTIGFAVHGLKALGGESYSARKKLGLDPWDMLDDRLAQVATGEWSEGRAAGTASSVTLIVQAIEAVLANEGQLPDEGEDLDSLRERIKANVATPEQRKSALARADINAEYQRISAERKAEQAKRAAEKAKQAAAAEGHVSLADELGLLAPAE